MVLTPFVMSPAAESFGSDIDENAEIQPFIAEEPPVTDLPMVDTSMIEVGEITDLPDDDDIDDIDEEIDATEALRGEIEHLINLAGAIEQYGISPGLMQFADRDGLLSSTFISIPATESMVGPYRPESRTSIAALEGVIDAIKAKTAEWAAKAGGVIKSLAQKTTTLIKRTIEGVTQLSAIVAKKAWSAAKASKTVIQAHPYATTTAAIVAITAAAVALSYILGSPPITPEAMTGWITKLRTVLGNIKSPFGTISLSNVGAHIKPLWTPIANAGKMVTGTLVKLGYGSKNVLMTGLAGLKGAMFKVFNVLKTGIIEFITFPDKVAQYASDKVVDSLDKRGTPLAVPILAGGVTSAIGKGFRRVAIMKLVVTLVTMLISRVILPGYRLIKSVFTKVSDEAYEGEAEASGA